MRAYERFLDYVKVHTTSDDTTGTHPSTSGQFDLARLLADQMRALGLENVRVDETCYVYGFLPATPGCEDKPAIGLIAHMDTSPAASGEGVKPQLIENYDGNDVRLPATGDVMEVSRFPALAACKGETLITADGSTLLGADDKAGIEVMEARLNYLAYAPEIAAAMLRRQQADAIISAREKIVEGAVSMVKIALERLSTEEVVELDEERKAAMVSNLLVVLCADEAAQPVVNTGTLHN